MEREKQEREKHPPVEFMITLFDGTPARVVFTLRYFRNASHFDFYGEMTSTGYRSHFFGGVLEGLTEAEIKDLAVDIANASRKEFTEQLRKEARKAGRRLRVPVHSLVTQP